MSENLPPLPTLRVFEAAARHLNFTRAGEELGMTQAAVSYHIKLLEERIGATLFVRQGRKLDLTDTGNTLAPALSSAFRSVASAFEAAKAKTGSYAVDFGASDRLDPMAGPPPWRISDQPSRTCRAA